MLVVDDHDLNRELAFYRDTMGLTVTEEITWNGHRCVITCPSGYRVDDLTGTCVHETH